MDWVDPLVGARIRHQWRLGHERMLRGDVGGFGAGSEFSWNVLTAYSFCAQNGVTYTGLLGYRALDVLSTSKGPAATGTNMTCCNTVR